MREAAEGLQFERAAAVEMPDLRGVDAMGAADFALLEIEEHVAELLPHVGALGPTPIAALVPAGILAVLPGKFGKRLAGMELRQHGLGLGGVRRCL